jgi:hypothetical protein
MRADEKEQRATMKDLKPVVLVRELPPVCRSQRQYLPSLRDQLSPMPQTDESQLLSYLGQGVDCGLYNDPGMLYDVLQPSKRIGMSLYHEMVPDPRRRHPHVVLTDGTWVWPGALIYYVAVYHVHLPEAFARHAASSQWRIDPTAINREELNWDAFDAIEAVAVELR